MYFKRTDFAQGTFGIFERAVTGDADRAVYRATTPLRNITRLQFSPDRGWLAFQDWSIDLAADGVTKRIRVLDVATGDVRTVMAGPANLVSWGPGGLLIERFGTDAASAVVIAPLDGSAPRTVPVPTFAPGLPGEPQRELSAKWSPDGRSLVLNRVTRTYETFVIEHPLAAVGATPSSRR